MSPLIRWLLAAGALLIIMVTPGAALAYTRDDTRQAIYDAHINHGVSHAVLDRVVKCETGNTYQPDLVGDRGTSFGAVQLNSLRTGLYGHFLAQGYDDAADPYQALDYLARVATGEFARQGITLHRWMCY